MEGRELWGGCAEHFVSDNFKVDANWVMNTQLVLQLFSVRDV